MDDAVTSIGWSSLSKSYGRQVLFRKLSGTVRTGTTTVVTGPNGAGKSTLLKIVVGLISPDSGKVYRPSQAAIGYSAPSIELYSELSGFENLQFFASVSGVTDERCLELLGLVGLSKSANKLYGSYSSGMRQRLKLAFALLRSPILLVLDEPTIALDATGAAIVDEIISNHCARGGSALIATNDPEEARRWAYAAVDLTK